METISHLNESADSAGLAACLANLSAVYVASGDLSKAEAVGVRGLQIVTRLSGGDDIGELLFRNLGAVYSLTDRPDSARVCFVRSAALGEKLYGKKSSEYASSLYYLACFYRDTRDFGEADSLFQIILKLRQETLGDRHPLVATTQYSMARLKQFQGDYADAIELAKQSLRLWTETLSDLMTTLSEDDALTYSAGSRWAVNEYFTCFELLGEKSEKLDREAADLCLASKGMVTDRLFLQRDLLSAMQDSATSSLLMQRQELRTKLAKLTAWRTKDPTSFARQGYLDSLSNAEEEVERKLAHRSAVFQSLNPDSEINCRQIAEVLPSGSSLVEYLKYDYSPFSSDSLAARYLALILSRDRQPEFVALGDAKSIDDLINQYRRHMLKVASLAHFPLQSDQKEYERISRALYRRIWKPIEGKIGDTDLIFVAPDGGLNLIAFGGLQNSKGEYVVEKHSLQYLSAGRDLIRLANRVSPASGLLAIGDPDYNAAPNARRSAGKDDQLATAATGGQFRNRSMKSGCKGLAEIRVSPLPGTRKEIEEVVRTWRDAGEGQALTYFGASASEDNFKRCAHGIRVIHLATHGYYYSQECRPNLLKRHMDQNGQYVGENPLLLSGLLLAGANLHGIGSDSLGLDDGNLTAEEISGMDLVGTQLVVLSACETGLGEVKDREGVYGLRRAFQMAGVRTVVSALWPISDQMTSDLMIPFYKSSSKSIPQRLRDIQLAAISKLKSEGLPTHPYLWGAFVAQGDWRP